MFRVVKNLLYFSQSFDAHKNYYKILNVSDAATPEAIKHSYKTLAKQFHPDFNKGKEEQFKEVNEAYQILSDEATKREYDQVRNNGNRYPGQNYRENYRPASDHPQDPRHSAENQWKSYQEYYNARHQAYQQADPRSYHNKNRNVKDQYMYEFYRQQQSDFVNRFHQSQKQKFSQGRYRSPIEEEYLRRFMEELAIREQIRRMKAEQQSQKQQQERIERERVLKQYEQSKQNIKDFFKGAWNAFLELKNRK